MFDRPENVMHSLRNLIGDPVTRGREFLHRNAGMHNSITDNGTALKENLSQLLILEMTNDR
jgi:hypothetical protein